MAFSTLTSLTAEAHADDLRRAAGAGGLSFRRGRRRRRRGPVGRVGIERAVTIRYAFPDDHEALRRLAALDSRSVPSAPVLLCEVDGELWAAVSLADGTSAADPFRPTTPVVELLAARAEQLCGRDSMGGRAWGRLARAMPVP